MVMARSLAAVVALAIGCSFGADFQENAVPATDQVRGSLHLFGVSPEKGSRRVLFLGNSITLHGPKPSIGWTNRCGMAASDLAHDYAHVYARRFSAENPGSSFALANVAASLERGFTNASWKATAGFADARAFRPDVIVVFFGANVPRCYDAEPSRFPRTFGAAVGEMLDCVDPERRAELLISEGYYIRPVLDAEKRMLAKARGATWVPMDDIRLRADTHGRFNHPNDLGMRLIAERFLDFTSYRIRPGDLEWRGDGLNAWTGHTASVSGCIVSSDGLTANMRYWQDACIEAGGACFERLTPGPELEFSFEARMDCPECERLYPIGRIKPLWKGGRDYSSQDSTQFRWISDGEWHRYSFRPFKDAQGRSLARIRIQLPNEGRSSGKVTFRRITLARRPVDPAFRILTAEADGFARVGKPAELRVRVQNVGTREMKNVCLTQVGTLPDDVHWSKAPHSIRSLAARGVTTLRGEVVSVRPGTCDLRFSVTADGVPTEDVTVPMKVELAPVVARTGYVPEPKPVRTPYEIAACYYPGWHEAERWSKIRRVCPERKPLLGWYDDTRSEVVDWQIKWLVEHGVSLLMLDWYWRNGEIRLEHYFRAFQQARHRRYLKWMVVWCNESQKGGGHSEADHRKVTQYWIDNYFGQPEYHRIDGKPAVGLFVPEHYVRDLGEDGTRRMLALSREMAVKAGYGGIHFIGYMRPEDMTDAASAKKLMALGFDETAYYNTMSGGGTREEDCRHCWGDTVAFNRRQWEIREGWGVPFVPIASSGWDDRPWRQTREVYGRNARDFRSLLKDLKAFADGTGHRRLMIGPLNEWGEGSFFEPNLQFGFDMLDAVRDVFCERPQAGWPANLVPADVGLGPYELAGAIPDLRAGEDVTLKGAAGRAWQPLGSHVKGLRETDAGLQVVGGTKTPAIVGSYVPFYAEDFDAIVVRCGTARPEKSGSVKVYWKSEGRPWCELCSAVMSGFVTDGKIHDCILRFAGRPSWSGIVTGLRLQFSFPETMDVMVEEVRFEKRKDK